LDVINSNGSVNITTPGGNNVIIKRDSVNNILESIISIKESLPSKQKKLCNYILENHKSVGLLTVKELADKAEVGTTTVLRVMNALGYKSFQDMRKDFHEISVESSRKWKYVQESYKNNNYQEYTTLSQVWQEGVNVLDKSLNQTLLENFQIAIDLIIKASRINILGLRPYKALAIYLELLIEEFYSKTRQLSYDSDSMFDRILQFEEDEIFIVFAFETYTCRTIDAAEIAHKNGTPIILVTDYLSCPIVHFATVVLKVEASEKHHTILPAIALIEAIVIELGKRMSDSSVAKLEKLKVVLEGKNIIHT
jgi:DNA-binding MurR/RpiR family transcriptional regulator